jgi:hypothetical protein
MDSMRSLNKSLPKAKAAKASPRSDIHQDFRTAALTVTNLYKSAVAEAGRARSEGYQEALEDLISFLDQKKLGLSDGEGWRIRQWATERLDGTPPAEHSNDSDEEVVEERRARSSSPAMERNVSPDRKPSSEPLQADASIRSDSAPLPTQAEEIPDVDMNPPQGIFHFTSPVAYPSTEINDAGPDPRRTITTSRRSAARASRSLQRTAASNLFSLGTGAGHKRKLMQEYFNIDGFNDRRDGSGGGGKRGRMS